MSLAMQLFDELSVNQFGGDAAEAHALLVGQTSKRVEVGIALSELARFAQSVSFKKRITTLAPERVLEDLTSSRCSFASQNRLAQADDMFMLDLDEIANLSAGDTKIQTTIPERRKRSRKR